MESRGTRTHQNAYLGLITYYIKSGQYDEIVRLIDQGDFFIGKAESFGIDTLMEDLENRVISCCVLHEDWEHFARYITLDLNLKRLAEQLSHELILKALVQNNRIDFVQQVIAQLADPLDRAAARAVVLGALENQDFGIDNEGYLLGIIQNQLEIDLIQADKSCEINGMVINWSKTLKKILECLNPDSACGIAERYIEKIKGNADYLDPLWIAYAKALAGANRNDSRKFWEVLRRIRSQELLLASLPSLITPNLFQELESVLEELRDFDMQPTHIVDACFIVLTAPSLSASSDIRKKWLTSSIIPENIYWELTDLNNLSVFLSVFSVEEIRTLISQSTSLESKLALCLAAAPASLPVSIDQIMHWIHSLPECTSQIHWLLKLIGREGIENSKLIAEMKDISLAGAFHFGSPADAAQFLNTLAAYETKSLKILFDLLVFSGYTGPETLVSIANDCHTEILLDVYTGNMEKYVCEIGARVGFDEAEKFKLRRDLLLALLYAACLLGSETGKHSILHDKLFEAELDEIYPVIIRLFSAGLVDQAASLTGYLRSRRLKFLVQLQLLPSGVIQSQQPASELLSIENLYRIFVDTTPMDDQILACEILEDHPVDAATESLSKIYGITENRLKAETLLNLAQNNLDYQNRAHRRARIKFDDINQLCIQAAGLLQSAPDLIAYTPWILRLSTEEKKQEASDEIVEAIKHILAFPGMHYHQKINSILVIFSRIRDLLINDLNGNPFRELDPARKISKLFTDLFLVADRTGDTYIKEQLSRTLHWYYVLLAAILNQSGSSTLPAMVDHPWSASLTYDLFAFIPLFFRNNGFFDFLARQEDRFSPFLTRERSVFSWYTFPAFAKKNLTTGQVDVITCARNSLADGGFGDLGMISNLNELALCLAFILTRNNPSSLPAFLRQFPNSELKDVVIARILLDGWLPDHLISILVSLLDSQLQDRELAAFLRMQVATRAVGGVHLAGDEKDHALEIFRMQWGTGFREKWFYYDVRKALDLIYRNGEISPAPLAKEVLAIIQHTGASVGVTVFQHWLQGFLKPRVSDRWVLEKKQRLALAKNAVLNAREIRHSKSEHASRAAESLPGYPTNSFEKFKNWRKELTRRWDQGKTIKEELLSTGILLLMLYSILLLFFDLGFNNQEPVQSYGSLQPFWGFWVLILLTYVVNAWLIRSMLNSQIQGQPPLKSWVNFTMLIFSGLPVWGLFAFPFNAWINTHAPKWLRKKQSTTRYARSTSPEFLFAGVSSAWAGNTFWRKGWFWWGLIVNMISTFLCVYYFFDVYIQLGLQYRTLGAILTVVLHILVFFNVAGVFWLEARQAELTGIRLYLKFLPTLLWIIPIPGLSLAGLFLYVFSISAEARQNTIMHKAFENIGKISRDPTWSELKANLEKEFMSLGWFRKIREQDYHSYGGLDRSEDAMPIQFSLKIRALMAGGAAFWLVKGIFQTGLPVEIIDKIMIVLLFVPLFLGFAGLLVALFQFLQALRNRRSNLPDPPIIVYFYISQLAFFSGCIFAYGLEIKDFEIASIFGALAFIFLAVKFIQIILDLLINIPKEKHQASFEHLFWVFLLIALISLPIDLSNNSAGSANWNAFAVFNTREFKLVLYQIIFEVSCPLLSFGLALALFTRFLSPFGFNHFFDRSLPQRTRLVLVFVGLTFLLPFGELCVPLWVYLKEKYWIYFEKQLELDHSEL